MTVGGPPPPERVPQNIEEALRHAEDVRELLEATMRRASAFTEEDRHRRADDEWSTVESIRHIVFVIDAWLSTRIKGGNDPFHPMGLPPHFVPRVLPGTSIDADAAPSFDEACVAVRDRLATVTDYVTALTDDELARKIGTHAETVGGGLGVIFDELTYHDHFINRDLDKIEKVRG